MTTEPALPREPYTVQGTGPYAVPWPYGVGDVLAAAISTAGTRTQLDAESYALTPESGDSGNLYLTTDAAALHAGGALILYRDTTPQQGWEGLANTREVGNEAQLDAMTRASQELKRDLGSTLRVDEATQPAVLKKGYGIVRDELGAFASGPETAQVNNTIAALGSFLNSAERFPLPFNLDLGIFDAEDPSFSIDLGAFD